MLIIVVCEHSPIHQSARTHCVKCSLLFLFPTYTLYLLVKNKVKMHLENENYI